MPANELRYRDEHGEYLAGSWKFNPHKKIHTPYTDGEGALTYAKVGHLA